MGDTRTMECDRVGLCPGGWIVSDSSMVADVGMCCPNHATVCRREAKWNMVAVESSAHCVVEDSGVLVFGSLCTDSNSLVALCSALFYCVLYGRTNG